MFVSSALLYSMFHLYLCVYFFFSAQKCEKNRAMLRQVIYIFLNYNINRYHHHHHHQHHHYPHQGLQIRGNNVISKLKKKKKIKNLLSFSLKISVHVCHCILFDLQACLKSNRRKSQIWTDLPV